MKRLLALLLCGLLAVTCSKNDGSSKDDENIAPDKDFPQLPDSDDVCLDMNDIVFMKYCYNNFDSNKDGSLSTSEALAVRSIDLEGSNVNDLKGIEHFQNLESLNCKNCEKLQSVDISHNLKLTKIGNSAFEGCISLTNISIPDSVTEIGDCAFAYCSALENITIPDSVTKVGRAVFFDCSSLLGITIPNSVTEIGDTTFHQCTSLISIKMPNNITTIPFATFYGCSYLTNITIPDSVTKIEEFAFEGCVRLIDITIPENVTKIESQAFSECSHLSIVHCKPTTPPQLDSNAFYANDFSQIIYVPTESVSAYKSASGWSYYSYRIVGYDF